ncbi:COBRA protein 7 [Spatholobus suberectus]|nr:COBRA protein 7 [Spatholobus suberectus]
MQEIYGGCCVRNFLLNGTVCILHPNTSIPLIQRTHTLDDVAAAEGEWNSATIVLVVLGGERDGVGLMVSFIMVLGDMRLIATTTWSLRGRESSLNRHEAYEARPSGARKVVGLVFASNAVLVDGTTPSHYVRNGTVFAGYPTTNLKIAVKTVDDLTQMHMQVQIILVSIVFRVALPYVLMPLYMNLTNDGFLYCKSTAQGYWNGDLPPTKFNDSDFWEDSTCCRNGTILSSSVDPSMLASRVQREFRNPEGQHHNVGCFA